VNLLLDSCTLIWLASEPAELSATATALINDPANTLYVSHASLWEIVLKHGAGKLALPDAPRLWWTTQVQKWGLIEIPLSQETYFRSSELPGHHKDPFDRIILAQAQIDGLQIVSPDHVFSQYHANVVW
jgi:PIN domain nuclease of toxin-antitoxin system